MDSILIIDFSRYVAIWKVQQRWKLSDTEFKRLLIDGNFYLHMPAESPRIAPNKAIIQRHNMVKAADYNEMFHPGSPGLLDKYSVFEFELSNPYLTWETNESQPEAKSTEYSLNPRRRNSYLKVIAAALCPGGNTSPLEAREQTGKLKQKLQGLGLLLDEQTVKSVLVEAAEFVKENRERIQ